MHPKYAPLSSHGVSTLTYGYQWALQVLPTFQARMSELMTTLEFIQTYLDDVLMTYYASETTSIN
jgi:hypothetical protein